MAEYGQVKAEDIQAGPDQKVQAKVGQEFEIRIDNEADDPGASLVHSYDQTYLLMTSCGYQPQYNKSSFLWARFMPKQSGTTTIVGVRQPHLINPLFIQNNFAVEISQ